MALIGSIAINMSVRTQQMVQAMNKAANTVKNFGAGAAKSLGNFGSQMASAGRATAGVVKEFYVAPLVTARKAVVGAVRGMGVAMGRVGGRMLSPFAATGRAIGGVVGEFYVAPIARAARFIGGISKKIGSPFAGLAAKAADPIGRAFGAIFSPKALKFGVGMALDLERGFRAIGSAALHATGRVLDFGKALAKQAAVGAAGGAAILFKVAQAASGLAEQTDRARVLFGAGADYITKKANVMGEAFGIARSDFVGAASEMGGMLKGMGYSADDAARLGAHFAALATDVASATQTSVPEAMERMRSGLAGESEAVRKWGVDLSEANLQIQAVRLGIVKTKTELSQAQKIQVRTILMDEKLAYAKGNLAKTAGGAENATKGLMGRIHNLAETIGTALLPIVGSAMTELGVGVQALSMLWRDWTAGVVSEQVGVVGAVGETAKGMGFVQRSVGYVADAFQTMKIAFFAATAEMASRLSKLVGMFSTWYDAITAIAPALGILADQMGGKAAFAGMSKGLDEFAKQQASRAESAIGQAPAHEAVDAYFAMAQDRIRAMRSEAATGAVNPAGFTPKADEVKKVDAEPKFASAMAAGSKEATNAILRSRYGESAAKGPAEETAKNTREANRALNQISMILTAGFRAGNALGGVLGANL
jgi:hypothetical protein